MVHHVPFFGALLPSADSQARDQCIETSPALLTPEDHLSNQLDRADSCQDGAWAVTGTVRLARKVSGSALPNLRPEPGTVNRPADLGDQDVRERHRRHLRPAGHLRVRSPTCSSTPRNRSGIAIEDIPVNMSGFAIDDILIPTCPGSSTTSSSVAEHLQVQVVRTSSWWRCPGSPSRTSPSRRTCPGASGATS